MAECPSLSCCPFFNNRLQALKGLRELLKVHYCKGSFASCARLCVAQAVGRERVPPDLYPAQAQRAQALLTEGAR